MPVTAGFEHFEADADTGVIGRGPTLAAAFAQTALGVFALMVDLATIQEHEVREVRAHGGSLESLLVNWLNECLYLHDVEGVVARRIEFATFDRSPGHGGEPHRLHSFLHGEDVDPERHAGTVVRAVTLDGVAVRKVADGFEIRVVLDVRGRGLVSRK